MARGIDDGEKLFGERFRCFEKSVLADVFCTRPHQCAGDVAGDRINWFGLAGPALAASAVEQHVVARFKIALNELNIKDAL